MDYEPAFYKDASDTVETAELTSPDATAYMEYAYICDIASLSAARLRDLPGSLQAKTFKEYLSAYSPQQQHEILCEVGLLFDDALLNFVTASLIGRRNQEVVIRASVHDGVNGWIPWEEKLYEHVNTLHAHGVLATVGVRVERVDEEPIVLGSAIENVIEFEAAPQEIARAA